MPIDISRDSNKFMRFFTIKDKKACSLIGKLLGKIWFEIQRDAHMEPVGKCPIKEVIKRIKMFFLRNI